MSCFDKEILSMCFAPDDGSDPIPVREVHIFNSDGSPRAMYYLNPTDGSLFNPSVDFLNGSLGVCKTVTSSLQGCIEDPNDPSQTIDVYWLVYSDGTVSNAIEKTTLGGL